MPRIPGSWCHSATDESQSGSPPLAVLWIASCSLTAAARQRDPTQGRSGTSINSARRGALGDQAAGGKGAGMGTVAVELQPAPKTSVATQRLDQKKLSRHRRALGSQASGPGRAGAHCGHAMRPQDHVESFELFPNAGPPRVALGPPGYRFTTSVRPGPEQLEFHAAAQGGRPQVDVHRCVSSRAARAAHQEPSNPRSA